MGSKYAQGNKYRSYKSQFIKIRNSRSVHLIVQQCSRGHRFKAFDVLVQTILRILIKLFSFLTYEVFYIPAFNRKCILYILMDI